MRQPTNEPPYASERMTTIQHDCMSRDVSMRRTTDIINNKMLLFRDPEEPNDDQKKDHNYRRARLWYERGSVGNDVHIICKDNERIRVTSVVWSPTGDPEQDIKISDAVFLPKFTATMVKQVLSYVYYHEVQVPQKDNNYQGLTELWRCAVRMRVQSLADQVMQHIKDQFPDQPDPLLKPQRIQKAAQQPCDRVDFSCQFPEKQQMASPLTSIMIDSDHSYCKRGENSVREQPPPVKTMILHQEARPSACASSSPSFGTNASSIDSLILTQVVDDRPIIGVSRERANDDSRDQGQECAGDTERQIESHNMRKRDHGGAGCEGLRRTSITPLKDQHDHVSEEDERREEEWHDMQSLSLQQALGTQPSRTFVCQETQTEYSILRAILTEGESTHTRILAQ